MRPAREEAVTDVETETATTVNSRNCQARSLRSWNKPLYLKTLLPQSNACLYGDYSQLGVRKNDGHFIVQVIRGHKAKHNAVRAMNLEDYKLKTIDKSQTGNWFLVKARIACLNHPTSVLPPK